MIGGPSTIELPWCRPKFSLDKGNARSENSILTSLLSLSLYLSLSPSLDEEGGENLGKEEKEGEEDGMLWKVGVHEGKGGKA